VGAVGSGGGGFGSKGWAVDDQPGMSVDGHSHQDHQKNARGLEAGKRGKQGGIGQQSVIHESAVRICITAHVCSHLVNIVFRL
jgi:hypothetical protein